MHKDKPIFKLNKDFLDKLNTEYKNIENNLGKLSQYSICMDPSDKDSVIVFDSSTITNTLMGEYYPLPLTEEEYKKEMKKTFELYSHLKPIKRDLTNFCVTMDSSSLFINYIDTVITRLKYSTLKELLEYKNPELTSFNVLRFRRGKTKIKFKYKGKKYEMRSQI